MSCEVKVAHAAFALLFAVLLGPHLVSMFILLVDLPPKAEEHVQEYKDLQQEIPLIARSAPVNNSSVEHTTLQVRGPSAFEAA